MHPQIRARLSELKALVLAHPAVTGVHIRGEEISATRGYLRMRLVLQSQDIVETFVYLSDQDGVAYLRDYSLHWQRKDSTLVQRWDTAPHHPELAGFPHHTHKAIEEVEPTEAYNWESFVALFEKVISGLLTAEG
jgi:hypothetical protein